MKKMKKQYYSNLSPSERIPKIIAEYIFPELEKIGFKMLKSGLSIKRDKNEFIQEIWFSKSKWNYGTVICEIEPHFTVTAKKYKRWHKSFYERDLLSDVVLSDSAKYVDGWDLKSLDGNMYDFAKFDNDELIDLLLRNIFAYGLKYLDSLSDIDSLTDYLIKEERYFKAPMMIDFQLMQHDYQKAKMISDWFWDYKNKSDDDFLDSTIEEMTERKRIINNLA